MKRSTLTRGAVPAALVLSLALAACGGGDESDRRGQHRHRRGAAASDDAAGGGDLSGQLVGAGASSQQAAVQAWVAGFNGVEPGVTVNYDPIGSGGGRELFLGGGSDFAGSDAAPGRGGAAPRSPRSAPASDVVELPLYISPIAVIFNLEGVDSVNLSAGGHRRHLRRDHHHLGRPGHRRGQPRRRSCPPPRSSPSTAPTTRARPRTSRRTSTRSPPTSWTYGEVETWPTDLTGEAGAPDRGRRVQAVQAGDGYIGYADASQAGDLGTVAVGVGDEFVPFSPEAAAAIVDVLPPRRGPRRGRPRHRAGPRHHRGGHLPDRASSATTSPALDYEDDAKAELVKSYLSYVASEEGQQAAADNAGSAPIGDTLREQVQAVIDAIQ